MVSESGELIAVARAPSRVTAIVKRISSLKAREPDLVASPQKHVVIIGGGFGGSSAARALKRAPDRLTSLTDTTITCFSRCSTRSRPRR